MKRNLVIVLLIVALFPSTVFPQSKKTEGTAVLLSTVVGFGTGHFYVQSPKGWAFLSIEAAGLATYGTSVLMAVNAYYSGNSPSTVIYPAGSTPSSNNYGRADMRAWQAWLTIGYSAAAVFVVSRIWEIVDIFRTVATKRESGYFASIEPSLEPRPNGLLVGIRMSY